MPRVNNSSKIEDETNSGPGIEQTNQGLQPNENKGVQSIVAKGENLGQISSKETSVIDFKSKEETPGYM